MLPTEPLRRAAARIGAGWARSFGYRVFALTAWTGLLFASGIGTIVWITGMPVRHDLALITAGVYATIALVSLAAVYGELTRVRDVLDRVAGASAEQRGADATGRTFVVGYAAVLAIIAGAYISLTEYRIRHLAQSHLLLFSLGDEFGAFLLVAFAGALVAYLVLTLFFADSLNPHTVAETASWPMALLAGPVLTGPARFRRRRRGQTLVRQAPDSRLDMAMLRLLDAAYRTARIAGPEGSWKDDADTSPEPAEVRKLLTTLELAAQDLEHYAIDRVPRLDLATRRAALHDGAQVAVLVRTAKARLARAIHDSEYRDVARALTLIITTWGNQHDDGFAPLVKGVTPVDRPPLWRRIGARVWSAALLTAAGIVLPALPAYANEHAAATGARYTLFTAAVFALATGKVAAWDAVGATLEKLPGTAEPGTSPHP